MKRVVYVGSADRRAMSEEDWARAGIKAKPAEWSTTTSYVATLTDAAARLLTERHPDEFEAYDVR